MMRKLLLLTTLLVATIALSAQTVRTIQEIQTVSATDLGNCTDVSAYDGDTVIVYGTVVTPGGIANSASGRQIWIQNGTGAFSGIDIRYGGGNNPTTPDDILDLVQGDSVKITGVVELFGNETQLNPLDNGVEIINQARPVNSMVVSIGDLNDNTRTNLLPTGEQWEGSYVELVDVRVTTVNYFAGNTRISFDVADAAGNLINISDRFDAQRDWQTNGFPVPNVGTVYDTIRGLIAHSSNGCTGGTGRGYEIFPFKVSDYAFGASAPIITAVTRNPVAPTSSQDINISANIEDVNPGGSVTSAELKFAVGLGTMTYTTVAMTNISGNLYQGTIPSSLFSDGDMVKYYICATDDENQTSCVPNVGTGSDPLAVVIRDNGLEIYDLQFTPFSNGNSIFQGLDVTVKGYVTMIEATNGTIYIQQPNATGNWTGIQLVPGLASPVGLAIGDEVLVGGTVQENFGLTRLSVNTISDPVLSTGNTLTVTDIDPSLVSTYDVLTNEKYEGMLMRVIHPTAGNKLFIVNENPDDPRNFAEYRVGADIFDPANGCRILAGRQTGSAPGSLTFSYVNDSAWATDAGIMTVDPYRVKYEDSLESVTGIMHYSFGNMKLLPRTNEDMVGYNGLYGPGVAVEGPLAGSKIVAYPNPSKDRLFVKFDFPYSVKADVILTDMMGRNLIRKAIQGTSGEAILSTSSLTAGTYVLTVQAEGVIVGRQKIVVQ